MTLITFESFSKVEGNTTAKSSFILPEQIILTVDNQLPGLNPCKKGGGGKPTLSLPTLAQTKIITCRAH